MLTNIAIALFAGALGSILTLAATNRLELVDMVKLPATDAENSTSSTIDPSVTHDSETLQILTLEQSVSDASDERAQLSEAVSQLSDKLDELAASLKALDEYEHRGGEVDSSMPVAQSTDGQQASILGSGSEPFGRAPSAQNRFTALLAAGVDTQAAKELQARRAQQQLARLELLDQASREGWADSEQLGERLNALEEQQVNLRDELGDDVYDRYLFEAGRPNRVSIESVIAGSAAEIAGLKPGDLISSYASERIFDVQDLQSATRRGVRGEYVQMLFDRGGRLDGTEIPRGPLGVTLRGTRVEP